MGGPNNPVDPPAVARTPAIAASPSVPEGWRSLSELPEDGLTVDGLLSDGTVTEAEYWAGPDERPDWAAWAWDATLRFGADDLSPELDLIAWRMPSVGDAKPIATLDADDERRMNTNPPLHATEGEG